jgi:membrane peptidoglycan carboxypeptidase
MPEKKITAASTLTGVMGLVAFSAVAGVLAAAVVTPAIVVSGALASQGYEIFDSLPADLEYNTPMEPSTIFYIDAKGNEVELASFYDQNRIPLTYEELTPMMINAVLSSEDKTFFEHSGINIGATVKALIDNLRNTSSRGASTITQQYVKNLLIQKCEQEVSSTDENHDALLQQCWEDATNATGQEGIKRKVNEMRYALQLEKNLSKEEILVGYLNIANFGGTNYGVAAAANYYFGKTLEELTIAETATLAGIVQNPNTYRIDIPSGSSLDQNGEWVNGEHDGYALAKERRAYVLGRMMEDGHLSEAVYQEALAEEITPNINDPKNGCAAAGANAYFCQYVKRTIETDPAFGETTAERAENLRRGGMKIYTTLDPTVQNAGIKVMKDRVPVSWNKMDFGAAAVTIEVGTGRILALVQNTKFTEREDQKDLPGYTGLVYAANQKLGGSSGFPVGSTYKLFTLLRWLELGHSVNEILDGRSRVFEEWYCHGRLNTNKVLIGNFAAGKGSINSVMSFTSTSLNTGYLAMATEIDLCEINDLADRMGLRLGTGGAVNEENSLGDIIGSKNIPPIDIANAYATVANGGVACTPHAIDKIIGSDGNEMVLPEYTCERVLQENVAATAAYAFAGVMNGGTGSASRPGDGIPLIGKTGTHERHQTMMVTSSTKTTTAVWVGNAIGEVTLFNKSYKGTNLSNLRHTISRAIVAAANKKYGGGRFPSPDRELTRKVEGEIPDVIGMTVEDASKAIKDAGFSLTVVKKTIDSSIPAGHVALQSRPAGKATKGIEVKITISNGAGLDIPDVSGMNIADATAALWAAGFLDVTPGTCTVDPMLAPDVTRVDNTTPAIGGSTGPSNPITLLYSAAICP